MKTTNIEIYNFLNLTSPRLGKIYKYSGFNPLPDGFIINKENIKERLFLSQMRNEENFPYFSCENKKQIKKHFKTSLKNCKNLEKIDLNSKNFSKAFSQKLEYYLSARAEITSSLLKEFKSHTFDEVEAFRELYNLDPIFGEFLDKIFDEKMEVGSFFEDLELRYNVTYLEKLQLIEKKKTKKNLKKKEVEENLQAIKKLQKNKENSKKLGKKTEKIAKNNQKNKNFEEIREIKREIKNFQNKEKQQQK